MSVDIESVSPMDFLEGKIEIDAVEEFEEYKGAPLYGSTWAQSISSNNNNNWDSCLEAVENPVAEGFLSIPVCAASLLDPSLMEQQGTLNGVKVEENPSLSQDLSVPEEGGNVHGDDKTFKCEICSADFKSSRYLNQHYQRAHSDERPFKCEVCLVTCKTSAHLKSHRIVHSEERPFKCQLCSRSYKASSQLKRHRIIHIEERPFKCALCLADFSVYPNT